MGVQLEHQLFTYEDAHEMRPGVFMFTGVEMTKDIEGWKKGTKLMSIYINYNESKIYTALHNEIVWEANLVLTIGNETF